MTRIESVILEVADTAAAQQFYSAAFGLEDQVSLRASDAPTSGFRGFTLSLIVSQPGDAGALLAAAVDAGATVLRPAAKSIWGFGGTVQAPDGTIWKVATSAKKDTAAVSRKIDSIVLLLGAADVAASKKFYTGHGFEIGRSLGSYVDFATPSSPIGLGLYKRRALAKDAGVPVEGSGSNRLAVAADVGVFTDPDGFAWELAAGGAEEPPAIMGA